MNIGEIITRLWESWYFHNSIVGILVVFFAVLIWKLSRRDYWREAFHRTFRRPIITVSFVILCIYATIALLDSIGYHTTIKDEAGIALRSKTTGKILRDKKGITVLDILIKPLKHSKEKTYSAPLAKKQFTKEVIVNDDGTTRRDYPLLKHPNKHILGTDKIGDDVLYLAIKSIRTGIVIGAITTLIAIPFALLFGITAGYFGGLIDDIIQYIYTVLASIPSLLLIAAFMILAKQGLPQLCIIMGITSWTSLCRVLRGETMKLREMEYVQAAKAMGISPFRIMLRHIVPNTMHIVLITAVLGFSGRILSEAILSYLGIGVGADTLSWGMMIADARNEMTRDPVVWWKLAASFIFMIGLLLPANLFGDALRDALDPRLRTD
ncbi:MAG: ABC transporter permease [Kiritimatiellae bacterium]|nr:ABC transporter permease [Kiritimatiellia bacterium]